MTQRDATGRSDRSPSDTAGASVTVRRAEPKDAPLVAAMVREIAEHEGQSEDVHVDDRDWSELLARPDVTVLLAEDGGHVAGYVSAVRQLHLWDGGDVLALDDLFVRPGHRDAGIGRRLMQELADVASREQLHIRWGVEPDNADAQRFYRRLGATLRPEGRGDLATRGDQREPRGIGAAAVSSSQRTRNRTAGPAAAAAPVGRSARRARPDERPAVRAVLPSAFQDDPLYRWLYPDAGVARPSCARCSSSCSTPPSCGTPCGSSTT
jgi:ribosomal protein S18 acetylase RimI-like enzyme